MPKHLTAKRSVDDDRDMRILNKLLPWRGGVLVVSEMADITGTSVVDMEELLEARGVRIQDRGVVDMNDLEPVWNLGERMECPEKREANGTTTKHVWREMPDGSTRPVLVDVDEGDFKEHLTDTEAYGVLLHNAKDPW